MPELPEVQTTVDGLKKVLPGLRILDVWTDISVEKPSLRHFDDTIKNIAFFKKFKKEVVNQKIISCRRRAKNILIELENKKFILIHLKMTGHLLYGKYKMSGKAWQADEKGPLQDPYNKYIHFVFTLSNGKHLAFCDARKFGKITLIAPPLKESVHLKNLGPEPLEKEFDLKSFTERLNLKPNGKIKTTLMDPSVIAGIGNIYSDEILWFSGAHPEQRVSAIPKEKFKLMFQSMKNVLKKGIDFGGDSTSDYRNIFGEKGRFHHHHNVYRRKGEKCLKKGCGGIIARIVVGGRSAHYCPIHQKLIK